MHLLNDKQYQSLTKILQITPEQLKSVVTKYLKNRYDKITESDLYVCAEGDIPIALVAHLDTVFKTPPTEILYDTALNMMISPQGAGFDDRIGVWMILQILSTTKLRPHVIFTMGEEVGGLGAVALAKINCPFADLRFMIELDRRGSNDCVFYDCDNPSFTSYIESFGFVENWGSYTDICDLMESWRIAGVNFSVGYRDEHTVSEVLFVEQALDTMQKVKKILIQPNETIPRFEFMPRAYYYNLTGHSFLNQYLADKNTRCDICGKKENAADINSEIIKIIDKNGIVKNKCWNCIDDLNWCICCDMPFESNQSPDYDPKHPICPRCARLYSIGYGFSEGNS